jgi:hypothetical protein
VPAYKQDVIVKYGDFTFPVPTPYVSKSYTNQFIGGDLWSSGVEIKLEGQIAILPKRDGGSTNNYSNLKNQRNAIAKAFAGALGKNFQKFTVSGHDTNFILSNCSVTNLSFGSAAYRGLLSYSVTLNGFDASNANVVANLGVQNPVDSWAYAEGEGGVATLTHTISAQGVNNRDGKCDAFLNAKAFVNSRKGTSNRIAPFFIKNVHPVATGEETRALILTTISENINRLGGSYGITENYSFATNESAKKAGLESNVPAMQTANMLLTYTLSVSEQQGGGQITVALSGNVVGSKDDSVSWEAIKADFKSRNFYDLANKAYLNYIRRDIVNLKLHKIPVTFSMSPDEDAKTIGFSISYDNDELFSKAKIKNEDGAYFDYNVSFSHDNLTDIITISCNGSIKTRAALHKKNLVGKALLDEILKDKSKKVRDEVQKLYHKMFPKRTQYLLNTIPRSISLSHNEFNGEITYQASFSDKDFPAGLVEPDNGSVQEPWPSTLKDINYSISVIPALQIYKPVDSCMENGHYLIYDLSLESRRENISVNVDVIAGTKSDEDFALGRDEILATSDLLRDSFLKFTNTEGELEDGKIKRLDSENKVESRDSLSITYNRSFSHEKTPEKIVLERSEL